MFGFGNNRVNEITTAMRTLESERDHLRDEVSTLGSEVKQLKTTRKIEEEDIKHMMKMKEGAMDLQKQSFELKCTGEKDAEIAKVKDQFRDKMEEFLKSQVKDTKEMYNQILQRLPDVNVKLQGKVG